MATDYHLCGWRVRSDIDLSELLPWQENDHAVDVEIRIGSIPVDTNDPVFVLPIAACGRTHDLSWTCMGGAGSVETGCRVWWKPAADWVENELKAFLLGWCGGAVPPARLLRCMPRQCAAGSAVLIAGITGAESTLAAALWSTRHGL